MISEARRLYWQGISAELRRDGFTDIADELASQLNAAVEQDGGSPVRDTNFAPVNLQALPSDPADEPRAIAAAHEVWSTAHGSSVFAAACSPDGTFVVSGGADKAARLAARNGAQDVAAAAKEGPSLHTRVFEERDGCISALAFSKDAAIAVASQDTGVVRVYDASKRSYRRAISSLTLVPLRKAGKNFASSLAFHPGGLVVVAGTADGSIQWLDMSRNRCLATRRDSEHHTAPVVDLCFSLDGTHLFSCSRDGAVHIWDGVENRRLSRIVGAHDGYEVNSVHVAPESQNQLLTAGNDGTLRIWDLRMGGLAQTIAVAGDTVRQSTPWLNTLSFNLFTGSLEGGSYGQYALGKCLTASFLPGETQIAAVVAGTDLPITIDAASGGINGKLAVNFATGHGGGGRCGLLLPPVNRGQLMVTLWEDQKCRVLTLTHATF